MLILYTNVEVEGIPVEKNLLKVSKTGNISLLIKKMKEVENIFSNFYFYKNKYIYLF